MLRRRRVRAHRLDWARVPRWKQPLAIDGRARGWARLAASLAEGWLVASRRLNQEPTCGMNGPLVCNACVPPAAASARAAWLRASEAGSPGSTEPPPGFATPLGPQASRLASRGARQPDSQDSDSTYGVPSDPVAATAPRRSGRARRFLPVPGASGVRGQAFPPLCQNARAARSCQFFARSREQGPNMERSLQRTISGDRGTQLLRH